jgi:putative membrane protein
MIGSWMMGPWLMGGWGWMGFAAILFIILIGVGIYLFLSGYVRPRRVEENRALAITRERYARGEITKEEYDEIYRNLSRS